VHGVSRAASADGDAACFGGGVSYRHPRSLRTAARVGAVFQCRRGGVRTRLAASVIRRQATVHATETDPHGILIGGAIITGQLDLAAVALGIPLVFDDCVFEQPINLDGADLHSLSLTACEIPGLLANGIRVRRDLDLSRSDITGAHRTSASTSQRSAAWLCEASIGGRLLCVDTLILGDGERALQADRIRIEGVVRLIHGFRTRGELRLLGAQIGGSLDLTAAHLDNACGLALELGDARIGGSLFITPDTEGHTPHILGRLDLNSAHISGQIVVRDLALIGPGRPLPGRGYSSLRTDPAAVVAPRLTVGVGITVEGNTTVTGGVDLSAADLGELSVAGGCKLLSPGQRALDLTNAEIRSSVRFHPGFTAQGTLTLSRARIHGRLDLKNTELSQAAEGTLVDAYGLIVDDMVDLDGLCAEGGRVVFNGANIQLILAGGARITNGGGQSLNLRQAVIRRSVLLPNFRSEGLVVLDGASIQGPLDCTGATFDCPGPSSRYNPRGDAISAIATSVRGGLHLGWTRCSPGINLTSTTTTVLADDPERWPDRYTIAGLTYDRFDRSESFAGNPWDARLRTRWLDRAEYDAGSYEQAARVFRQHGYTTEAEYILIRGRDAGRRESSVRGRQGSTVHRVRTTVRSSLDGLFGRTVGYGYRPGRALIALLALLAAVVAVLALPITAGALRATDARGNVYATDGRLVTVAADAAAQAPGPGQGGTHPATVSQGTSTADACGNGQVRCFNTVLYGIDTVLPLVDLKQRATWYPNPHANWGLLVEYILNAATLLGWLLSTIVVLSFARLARTT
jgi:hypothetical protein